MPTVSVLNTTSNISGKTLLTAEQPYTVSGLITFSRSPSAPFAVAAGSANVPNLDADKLDGIDSAGFARLGFANSGNLIFTDATYDIGASGATRPRDLFLSRDITVGRNAILADDVKVAATKKVFLDGGGDTYIVESAANTVDLYTNNVRAVTVDSTQFIDSPTQARAIAYHNTTQSINNTTETVLNLNSEDVDTATMHDTATNNSRITIPTGGDGFYLFTVKVPFASNAVGERFIRAFKNGVAHKMLERQSANTVDDTVLTGSFMLQLAAADYIEIAAYQSSGGALNIGSATRSSSTEICATKLW